MFTDNPSYFSLSSGGTSSTTTQTSSGPSSLNSGFTSRGFSSLFRRKHCKMGSTSSASITSNSTTSTLMHDSNRSSTSGLSPPSTPTEERVPMLSRQGENCNSANQKMSFRNLFRSVSANADHERTQQFLKGDPRPSDVAPPSPYLPHRSHSHTENDRRRPRKRRVLKSASELLSNDMIYCGLPGEDVLDGRVVDEDDNNTGEVFLGVEDARYYNLSSTLPAAGSVAQTRRHSIGTFLVKERTTNNGASGGVCFARRKTHEPEVLVEPSIMAPPIPTNGGQIQKRRTTSKSRRRKHRNFGKGKFFQISYLVKDKNLPALRAHSQLERA